MWASHAGVCKAWTGLLSKAYRMLRTVGQCGCGERAAVSGDGKLPQPALQLVRERPGRVLLSVCVCD